MKDRSYKTPLLRFLDKTQIPEDRDACWTWTGMRDGGGYGQMRFEGRVWQAPRVAYTLIVGPIPHDFDVLHACDNPVCVNPRHLSVGTPKDNMRQAVARGRWRRNVLTDADRDRIVADYISGRSPLVIAKEAGVTPTSIYKVLNKANVQMRPRGRQPRSAFEQVSL